MKKIILYPIVVTIIIILVIACNWCITAFLALIFQTTISNIACSPFVLLYLVSIFATIYLCVNACEHINENL